jgi:DNA-binding Xre family transcriptional regulator
LDFELSEYFCIKLNTMNSLAVQAGVAATTITRLARTDEKAAAALSLDLAGKIVTVLDCGIEDLLEVVEKS